MKTVRSTTIFLVLYVLCGALGAQEIAYVTDRLILNLFADQEQSGEPIKSLPSGTILEVLQRANRYAQVRTEDGEVGWVKSTFLVSDKPTRHQLAEAQAELDTLRRQFDDQAMEAAREQTATLRTELEETKANLTNAQDRIAGLDDELAQAKTALDEANARYDTLQAEQAAKSESPFMAKLYAGLPVLFTPQGVVAAVSSGVALLVGLILGMMIIDRRQRKRLSGHRLG